MKKQKLYNGTIKSSKTLQYTIYQLKAFFGFKWYLLSKKQKQTLISYLMNNL